MGSAFLQEFGERQDYVYQVWGVPRGGVPVAYLLGGFPQFQVTDHVEEADLIVDDLVDSGRTKSCYKESHPNLPFLSLLDFCDVGKRAGQWVVFPWETSNEQSSEDDIIVRLLQYVGEDPNRGGLLETPKRVLKAWKEWTKGYGMKPEDVIKTFEDGADDVDEMVMLDPIPFYSHCEHHMAPFFGNVLIGYIPDKRIVGLSKFVRLTRIFSQRLQVQERMTVQIANAIQETLKPQGVAVIVRARHMCMESRGVCASGVTTRTSKLLGVCRSEDAARLEMLKLTDLK